MDDVKSILSQWREDLLIPNQNDVLVQLIPDKNALEVPSSFWESENNVEILTEPLLNKLVKKAKENLKESGVETLGIAKNCIAFEFENKVYHSPLILVSCKAKLNRIKKSYEISVIDDPYFNPFLNKLLGINIQTVEEDEILSKLNELGLEFTLSEGIYIANFHPHRFILLKEIENLAELPNTGSVVNNLLTGSKADNIDFNLHNGLLFNADYDQRKVFETVTSNHTVVQGPPGTGKSQVIANLLGKTLAGKQSALLVAEKQVALNVIYDLFKTYDLHHFCLIHHHQLKAKDFIQSLKETWEYLEKTTNKTTGFSTHSDLLLSSLQLSLDRLKSERLIGGLSYAKFKEKYKQLSAKETQQYLSEIPMIDEWEKDKVTLSKLTKGNIFEMSWRFLKFPENESELTDFSKKLNQCVLVLKKIAAEKWKREDIASKMRISSMASYFFYQDQLLPQKLFIKDSKTQNEFLKTYGNFIANQDNLKLLKDEKKNWKKDLNLTQLLDYTKVLSDTNRFNIRTWRKKKELLQFSNLDLVATKEALNQLMELKRLERTEIALKNELRKNNLPTDEIDLTQIVLLIKRVNNLEKNKVKELVTLSGAELRELSDLASDLELVYTFIKKYILHYDSKSIYELLLQIKEELPYISANYSLICSLQNTTKEVLVKANSIEEAEQLIFANHWMRFQGMFPDLSSLSGADLKEKIEKIITQESLEQNQFATYIISIIKKQFEGYHQLLQTPARKLSEKDKALKKSLRKGKSILVKSFAKSRNHLTPLELFSNEANLWISILKPIILGSPYSVAKSFPIKKSFFDLVIFDEASQIPLAHSIGSVFRAKRVVVAGDSQQMAPSFYFQSSATDNVDLLHQASYYWKNSGLTHHYRSEHPQLIEFSNRYFYEGKLQPFPALNAIHPFEVIEAKGIYDDRVNQKEAAIAAKIITEKINQKDFNFGIATFSQIQLKHILNLLSPEVLEEVLNEDNNILVQSLENIQGEQCDHLIISLGYAKNKEGKFNMQFGPLNKENGYRRLNVLLSRARKKITFIRSVEAADFNISDNEGADLLRKLMIMLETKSVYETKFPFNLQPDINEHSLTFDNIHEKIDSARKLVTIHKVLKTRGWELKYGL